MRLLVSAFLLAVVFTFLAAAPHALQAGSGKAAFDRTCAECHGAEGRGKGGADDAPSIVPMDKDYETLLALVREGGCKMPALSRDKITDDEVRQVLDYLRSVSASSAKRSAGLTPAGC
jgi:mono/diheme cytochrome c family protein